MTFKLKLETLKLHWMDVRVMIQTQILVRKKTYKITKYVLHMIKLNNKAILKVLK